MEKLNFRWRKIFFFVFENDAAANAKNLLQTFEFQKKEVVYES